jgi:outer membrane protein
VVRQRTSFPADQTAALSIKLTMPIFDSGEISAKVAVARERERQAQIALAQARRQVREDVLQALLDLKTSETDLALAKEQLAAAEAEYNQSFELYRAQEATSLDLQTSETALSSSRRAVVNGTLNRDLAELNVWSAVGTLKNLILNEEGAK